jgi:hypothetical protein
VIIGAQKRSLSALLWRVEKSGRRVKEIFVFCYCSLSFSLPPPKFSSYTEHSRLVTVVSATWIYLIVGVKRYDRQKWNSPVNFIHHCCSSGPYRDMCESRGWQWLTCPLCRRSVVSCLTWAVLEPCNLQGKCPAWRSVGPAFVCLSCYCTYLGTCNR